jgi:lysophospholipase L1-like esterase
MKPTPSSLLLPLAAALAACSGGPSSGPDGVPTPVPKSPVSGFVFYDENGNGLFDPTEAVRLPGVTVAIGGATAQTTAGGRFTVEAPNGTQSAAVQPASLPAYFTPGTPVSLGVPQAGDLAVPAALALGARERPNLYLAFGDSITWGDGSSNHGGYRDPLVADLQSYWGKADIYNDGVPGTKSNRGESRIGSSLAVRRPAYVLILYGTNDYNDAECRNTPPCYTIDALRSIIVQTREVGAFPVLGTIPPVNPAYVDKGAADRNDWVKLMNGYLRTMATQEQVAVADVYGDLLKQSNLAGLFNDQLHPNDDGYRVISRSFFNAITRPVGASGSRRPRAFSFLPHGS